MYVFLTYISICIYEKLWYQLVHKTKKQGFPVCVILLLSSKHTTVQMECVLYYTLSHSDKFLYKFSYFNVREKGGNKWIIGSNKMELLFLNKFYYPVELSVYGRHISTLLGIDR